MDFFSGLKAKTMELTGFVIDPPRTEGDVNSEENTGHDEQQSFGGIYIHLS